MINIDFTNIDHAKMVGRLLPFWARGKKMSLLLQALIYPLKYAHTSFQKWALERYIENHITGQKMSLEWYLKYRLKSHFANPEDNFFITQSVQELIVFLSAITWDNEMLWDNDEYWYNGFEGKLKPEVSDDMNGETIVYTPAIVETVNYDYDDYKRDIRYIMSKYMINFSKINIVVSLN